MDMILESLKTHKHLTNDELVKCSPRPIERDALSRTLNRMMKPNSENYKRVYIIRWEHRFSKKYKIWKAVYALGNRKDAIKPPAMTKAERKVLYRQKKEQRMAMAMGIGQLIAKKDVESRVST